MSKKYEVASAHGRFQPVHNGHMEYLLAAMDMCDHLIIGLTQISRTRLSDISSSAHHRAYPSSNPLSFYERSQLVTSCMLEQGVSLQEFTVMPFPIEDRDTLSDFLPLRVPVLTTVYDDWNREKVTLLKDLGYSVEVLWERTEKEFEGAKVRSAILANDETLESMVPTATIAAVERLDIVSRLA